MRAAVISLHWLRISWRIRSIVAVLVYKVLHGCAPSYLGPFTYIADLLLVSRRGLRSSCSDCLVQPLYDVQAHRLARLDVWSVDSTFLSSEDWTLTRRAVDSNWLQPIDCWTVDVWLRRRDGSDVFSLTCRVLVEFLDARVICEKQIIVFCVLKLTCYIYGAVDRICCEFCIFW